MDFKALNNQTRLLIQAELQPLQGSRFQPTGFPDLGAAVYSLPGEKQKMLLLESAQSVANRMESTIWDEAEQTIAKPLDGISYVKVEQNQTFLTNSLLEAHRLNSPYIVGTGTAKGKSLTVFGELVKKELESDRPFDLHLFATVLAKYDVNSLLHGIFLEKMSGVSRIARALSGFIEAKNIEVVRQGGVKNDRVDATGKTDDKGGAADGFGNVPYYREEYAAESITAYFSLDLAQIRSYRLGVDVENLLIAIALYKVQVFLTSGLRLRTACDLEVKKDGLIVKRPEDYVLPSIAELEKALPGLVKAASGAFADPAVTVVQYEANKKK